MKLSKNSWHYKLNQLYTWKTPVNLCPYFWRTAWYALILIPTLILFVPVFIVRLFDKKGGLLDKDAKLLFSVDYPAVFVLDMAIFILFCMISMWFHLPHPKLDAFWTFVLAVGSMGWLMVLIGVIATSVQKIQNRKTEMRVKEPNLFKEFWKAKKQKYCPIIEWEEDNGAEILQE